MTSCALSNDENKGIKVRKGDIKRRDLKVMDYRDGKKIRKQMKK